MHGYFVESKFYKIFHLGQLATLDRHIGSGSYPVELLPGSKADAHFRWMLHSYAGPEGVPVLTSILRSQGRDAEAHDWELGFQYFQEPEPRLDLIALCAVIQYAPRDNLPVLSTTLAQYYQAGFVYRPPNLRIENSAQRFERVTRDAALLPFQVVLEQQNELHRQCLSAMTRWWTGVITIAQSFVPPMQSHH